MAHDGYGTPLPHKLARVPAEASRGLSRQGYMSRWKADQTSAPREWQWRPRSTAWSAM